MYDKERSGRLSEPIENAPAAEQTTSRAGPLSTGIRLRTGCRLPEGPAPKESQLKQALTELWTQSSSESLDDWYVIEV